MFSVALFTKAKKWKQAEGPPADVWIKNMWFMCTMKYQITFSLKKKKKGNPVICYDMNES